MDCAKHWICKGAHRCIGSPLHSQLSLCILVCIGICCDFPIRSKVRDIIGGSWSLLAGPGLFVLSPSRNRLSVCLLSQSTGCLVRTSNIYFESNNPVSNRFKTSFKRFKGGFKPVWNRFGKFMTSQKTFQKMSKLDPQTRKCKNFSLWRSDTGPGNLGRVSWNIVPTYPKLATLDLIGKLQQVRMQMGMQRGPHKVTSILRQQANAQAVPRERSARVYHF